MLLTSPSSGGDWLRWEAPPSCPDEVHVREAIIGRLGREPSEAKVSMRVDADDEGHALTLDMTVDEISHAYALRDADCHLLADAGALLVAVNVDALATSIQVSTPKPEEPPSPPTRVSATAEPEPPAEPEPELRSPTTTFSPQPVTDHDRGRRTSLEHVVLTLLGGAERGALPSTSFAPRLRMGLGWEHWRLEAAGTYFTPSVARTPDGAVRVMMGTADVRGCWRTGGAKVEAPMCGGLEVGGAFAEGLRDPARRTARGLWLAGALSAGLHWWFAPRMALVGRAELSVPAIRTAYDVRDPGAPVEVFTPGLVSGRIWLGLEAKIWRPQ